MKTYPDPVIQDTGGHFHTSQILITGTSSYSNTSDADVYSVME